MHSNDYAYKVGFGIRRHNIRYFGKSDEIKGREYVCCKEGFKETKKNSRPPAYTNLETRTSCKAKA